MTEIKSVQYTAKTHTSGGRDGSAHSNDGRLDIRLTVPGTIGTGTNPEQLLAAGWSACLLSGMVLAARNLKVTVPSVRFIYAEVDLCRGDDGYFLRARLNFSLPGVNREIAKALMQETHRICPYSKAMHGNIDVAINLVDDVLKTPLKDQLPNSCHPKVEQQTSGWRQNNVGSNNL